MKTKIDNLQKQKKETNKNNYLDTLAQLSTIDKKSNNNSTCSDKLNLQKRARSKAFTLSYLFDLIDQKSPLIKSYWTTYHCCNVIIQEGTKISSKYCNQRWCLTCNRIRTAKIINGYKDSIEQFKDSQFLTLTIPNVKGKHLKVSIEEMNKNIRDITKNVKKTYGIKVKALRKYECTYNKITNEYHPHFHFIIEGSKTANIIVDLWLKKYPLANRKAQDIREAEDNSIIELCKYFTKIIAKDNDYNPKALDIMFRASKNKRTFQPMGINKIVSEEVEEIQSQEIDFKEPTIEIYAYEQEHYDWISASAEILSGYEPTKEDLKILNQEYKQTK